MREVTGSYGNAIRLNAAIYFLGALAYFVDKGITKCSRQTNKEKTYDLPEVKIGHDRPPIFRENNKENNKNTLGKSYSTSSSLVNVSSNINVIKSTTSLS